ncbi:hypothetical protein PR202_ga15554 [Eleusine coracana subsp. coracana]|uniref:Basic proline-rich protein-like n=1 Tax=Eleusine coracana subsp. coracana TaxID=191504 RepID=A0AAV5CJA2_ELECO|nr:hypothetical protein PR202_ga15554 [Eleusine coracana subsp. coracana]
MARRLFCATRALCLPVPDPPAHPRLLYRSRGRGGLAPAAAPLQAAEEAPEEAQQPARGAHRAGGGPPRAGPRRRPRPGRGVPLPRPGALVPGLPPAPAPDPPLRGRQAVPRARLPPRPQRVPRRRAPPAAVPPPRRRLRPAPRAHALHVLAPGRGAPPPRGAPPLAGARRPQAPHAHRPSPLAASEAPPLPGPARPPRRLPGPRPRLPRRLPRRRRPGRRPPRPRARALGPVARRQRAGTRLRRGRAPRPPHLPLRRPAPPVHAARRGGRGPTRCGDHVPAGLAVHQRRSAQAVDTGGGEVPRRGGARVPQPDAGEARADPPHLRVQGGAGAHAPHARLAAEAEPRVLPRRHRDELGPVPQGRLRRQWSAQGEGSHRVVQREAAALCLHYQDGGCLSSGLSML